MTFDYPLVLLLLLPAAAVALWTWQHGYLTLSPGRRLVALILRFAILTLLVLGLAAPTLLLPQSRQATVVVADLSASDASSRAGMQSFINSVAEHRPTDGMVGVVSAAHGSVVEQPVSPLTSFDGFQSAIDPAYTNLESGLELGGAILPDGYRKRVVLMSDGQENVGSAALAAQLLRDQGTRVDVVREIAPSGPEVRVDAVTIPQALRADERFSLLVTLTATVATRTEVNIYRDHTLIASHAEIVSKGNDRYSFSEQPPRPGFHTYTVHISPAVDTQAANNIGSAFTLVGGAPRVLVVAWVPHEAANIVRSLQSSGIGVDLRTPALIDPSLSYLQRYGAVVIVDTPAPVLSAALLTQLVPYVRDLGHGLVVIGGEASYSLGAYGQTPLETVLPVKMDLPRRKDLPSAAVVLIVESLEEPLPINISKEAGEGVVKFLTEGDYVAVNDTPDIGSGWIVPMQHPRNKLAIDLAISGMNPGDPRSYTPSLQAAYTALQHVKARVKHIILLGDGDAPDGQYQSVVHRLRAGGVTVSTVITNGGDPSDFATMRDLAHWGSGKYYRADNPKNIPHIFLREARTIARSGVTAGKFYPQRAAPSPMVRNLTRLPPLYGYVTTAPKPAAEVVLASRKLDPVLADWQFGLGRTVAWTSDAAGLWTRDWLASAGAKRFWADMVEWTLPAAQSGRLFMSSSISAGNARISVDTPPRLGGDPAVTVHVVAPDLTAQTLHLQPVAPGRYAGVFPARQQGAYLITAQAEGAGHAAAGQGGVDVPYSAEYRTSGSNIPLLRTIARLGGGRVITSPSTVWTDSLSPVYDRRSLTDVMWLLAVLLLPVDIAARRLVVKRGDLKAAEGAIHGWRIPMPSAPMTPSGSQPRPRPIPAPVSVAPLTRRSARSKNPGIRADDPPRAQRAHKEDRRPASAQATVNQLLAAKRRKE